MRVGERELIEAGSVLLERLRLAGGHDETVSKLTYIVAQRFPIVVDIEKVKRILAQHR